MIQSIYNFIINTIDNTISISLDKDILHIHRLYAHTIKFRL
ncbi:hypothetical protein MCHI_002365 [Candidatus Magnetoovum chiemensis]|nr:hypothetical protein MCHI_002365 [Candidatus Magnetoovum chiemensis]